MKRPIGKIWGRTTELFRNDTMSTHYLEIEAGGYCSQHRHMQKENVFCVIEGELEITWWDGDDDRKVVIMAGEHDTVSIGVWHMFRAITHVKCIEIYDYRYDGVDIERRTAGGLNVI